MECFFLGLDSSTQALKASLLESNLNVKSEIEVRFDQDLPQYGTKGGTLLGPSGSGIVYSPVMQLVEAIDLLFDRMKEAQWPVESIKGVSAAGQQHASVYWSLEAENLLAKINTNQSLAAQLEEAFSRQEIPNWQDSSTIEECKQLEEVVGGPSILARRTGSRAHTRFTAPQIMRFKRSEPEAYEKTSRISLVSSFITTMLCLDGAIKGIDESDACGMNIWNMEEEEGRGWDPLVLEAIAGKEGSSALKKKLGRVESDGGRIIGQIGEYFVRKHGFSKDCIVCPGTGDNPATFLAFTLKESEALISLGTSDTVLVSTSTYTPDPEYHAFFHPAQIVKPARQDKVNKIHSIEKQMRYFNMLVYKNGSLAREYVRDEYFDSSWDAFNAAVEANRSKKAGDTLDRTGFYWLKPDIIPANALGIHKYSRETSVTIAEKVLDFKDRSTNAIAILESQMISYRSRVSAILGEVGSSSSVRRVYATGGAASNPSICNVMADVFNCNVCKPVSFDVVTSAWKNANWNACSVAAAYKAAWAWHRHVASDEEQKWVDFDTFIQQCRRRRQHRRLTTADKETNGSLDMVEEDLAIVARPDEIRAEVYSNSIQWWKTLEERALEESRQ